MNLMSINVRSGCVLNPKNMGHHLFPPTLYRRWAKDVIFLEMESKAHLQLRLLLYPPSNLHILFIIPIHGTSHLLQIHPQMAKQFLFKFLITTSSSNAFTMKMMMLWFPWATTHDPDSHLHLFIPNSSLVHLTLNMGQLLHLFRPPTTTTCCSCTILHLGQHVPPRVQVFYSGSGVSVFLMMTQDLNQWDRRFVLFAIEQSSSCASWHTARSARVLHYIPE